MGCLCESQKNQNLNHKYEEDSGTRLYCIYNNQKYYLASHKYYDEDKLDEDSVLLIVHNNWRDAGMNFEIKAYKNGICLSYKDNVFGMKNWNLYIKNGIPVFHRYSTSDLVFEPFGEYILIKDINSNSYLYMDLSKKRDDNKYGRSFYVGICKDRNKATKFKRIDK